MFINDNAKPHRDHIVDYFFEPEVIHCMDCLSMSPDLNSIKHVWNDLLRSIAFCNHPFMARKEWKAVVLEEWALLPLPKKKLQNGIVKYAMYFINELSYNKSQTKVTKKFR